MKLALGTVQFGLNYGIANAAGQTSSDETARILNTARLAGIDTLDTAPVYGDSEQVLGEIGIGGWKVVSKVPSIPHDTTNGRDWVVQHVRQSLERLRIDRLDGLLLHDAADLLKAQGMNIAMGLRDVKAEGLVGKIGYSIYSPNALFELCKIILPDLIQAPLNVFDQRLVKSGWLGRLADAGVEVHVRSIFLQGLLLMKRGTHPVFFDRWNALWQRWDAMVDEHGGSALSLCLGFVKAQSDISRIVVGVENLLHLEQLLATWEPTVSVDGTDLTCDDTMLIEPCNWKLT